MLKILATTFAAAAWLLFMVSAVAEPHGKGHYVQFDAAKDSNVSGHGHLIKADEGLRITGKLSGLPAGKHALVMVDQPCSDAMVQTGEDHFELKEGTGGLPGDNAKRLVGGGTDLIALTVAKAGTNQIFDKKIDDLALEGEQSIKGNALVIARNAYETDRSGASTGGRLACADI